LRSLEYRGGSEGRAEGGAVEGAVGMEALSLRRGFFGPPSPHVYPVANREQPVFEYLDSNYGNILGGPTEKLDIGDLSPLFLPFTENV
jgi:hypothetical protein